MENISEITYYLKNNKLKKIIINIELALKQYLKLIQEKEYNQIDFNLFLSFYLFNLFYIKNNGNKKYVKTNSKEYKLFLIEHFFIIKILKIKIILKKLRKYKLIKIINKKNGLGEYTITNKGQFILNNYFKQDFLEYEKKVK